MKEEEKTETDFFIGLLPLPPTYLQNQDTALCPTILHFGNVTWPDFGLGLWTEPEPVAEDDISIQQSLVSEAGTILGGGEGGVGGRGGGGGEERGGRGAGGSVLSTGGRGLSQWNGAGVGAGAEAGAGVGAGAGTGAGAGVEGSKSEARPSSPSGGPVLNVWRGGGVETDIKRQKTGVAGKTTEQPGRSSSLFFGRTTNSTTTTSTTKDPLRADLDSVLSAVIRRIKKEEERKRKEEEGAGLKSSSWTSWQVIAMRHWPSLASLRLQIFKATKRHRLLDYYSEVWIKLCQT